MDAMMDTTSENTKGIEDMEDIENIEIEDEAIDEVDEMGEEELDETSKNNYKEIPEPDEDTITSPIKAIRAKCLDCCCWQRSEVTLCPAKDCPLWAFRFGKNPYNKRHRDITEEQKDKMRERLVKAREARKSKKNENE